MIAATNPFLGRSTPIMPIGTEQVGDLQLVRLETHGGRIVSIPAALPPSSLTQICGGTSWLTGQFPNGTVWRSSDQPDGHGQPAFCAMKAARALIDACRHAEEMRRKRKAA